MQVKDVGVVRELLIKISDVAEAKELLESKKWNVAVHFHDTGIRELNTLTFPSHVVDTQYIMGLLNETYKTYKEKLKELGVEIDPE